MYMPLDLSAPPTGTLILVLRNLLKQKKQREELSPLYHEVHPAVETRTLIVPPSVIELQAAVKGQ